MRSTWFSRAARAFVALALLSATAVTLVAAKPGPERPGPEWTELAEKAPLQIRAWIDPGGALQIRTAVKTLTLEGRDGLAAADIDGIHSPCAALQ